MALTEKRITTPEEYRAALLKCYKTLVTLFTLPLDELVEQINHAETVGPIIDPTLYRARAEKMYQDKQVVLALQKAVRYLPEELRRVMEALALIELAKQLSKGDADGNHATSTD